MSVSITDVVIKHNPEGGPRSVWVNGKMIGQAKTLKSAKPLWVFEPVGQPSSHHGDQQGLRQAAVDVYRFLARKELLRKEPAFRHMPDRSVEYEMGYYAHFNHLAEANECPFDDMPRWTEWNNGRRRSINEDDLT